ncbi:MAG: hypothetical protein ABIN45_01685 [Gammaproteobacteria bacterium]
MVDVRDVSPLQSILPVRKREPLAERNPPRKKPQQKTTEPETGKDNDPHIDEYA